MINFDEVTKKNNIKEHNANWSKSHDYPYNILII